MIPKPRIQLGDIEGRPAALARIGRYRWLICFLLFLVTVNNYVDRQMLSIAAPAISFEFKLSNSEIATAANAFLIAYTFGQLFAGVLIDRIGARMGFTLATAFWSITAAATALTQGIRSLSLFRFLLGVAESVNFPGGVKVCAEWFPPKELATAVGIFQSGSSVGAIVAPITAAFLIEHFGWRAAFVVVAIPGFLWVVFWRRYYYPVESTTGLGRTERDFILAQRMQVVSEESETTSWMAFLRQRTVWAVAWARFLEEPAGWFYFTWLPIYLKNYRSVPLVKVGALLFVPFLTFDLGKVGGGWISSLLLRRGWSLNWARKALMLGSAICLTASIPAVFTGTPLAFVLLISIATFGHGCWATTTQTIPGDIVPPRCVGTVYGITACGGGLGATLFTQLTGKLVDLTGSFNTPLFIAGAIPLTGFIVFCLLAPDLKPLEMTPNK